MTEEFLHYIWKFRLFDSSNFNFNGEAVEIKSAGEHNTNAGPDFTNARIKIGNTTWAGNIEIHLNASDWIKHGHHKDNAYNNIILHVVYHNDATIKRQNNEIIPVIELKNKYNPKIFDNYQSLMSSALWAPCQNQIKDVRPITIAGWLEHLVIERLEKKVDLLRSTLKLNKNNWEQTFYQNLARNFGFKLNAEPFELLAKSLPINYLAKHKNNLLQIEAMLFGQAGLLDKDFHDEYPNALKKEYTFLQQKFSLIPIEKTLWKFLRLRPSNFPTIRIAQFATLIHQSSGLFSKIIESENIQQIEKLFQLKCSEYWNDHYIFDKATVKRKKILGRQTINLIIINTIIPFLFLFGKEKNEAKYIEKTLRFLEKVPAEKNTIIEKWQAAGLQVRSSFESQALLELKNNYCNHKKCLSCRIGNDLLKK